MTTIKEIEEKIKWVEENMKEDDSITLDNLKEWKADRERIDKIIEWYFDLCLFKRKVPKLEELKSKINEEKLK